MATPYLEKHGPVLAGAHDGFEHLETHVYAERPTWVFVAYGTNESFAGPEGLDAFAAGLRQLLDVLSATGAGIVLMTPIPHENLGPPLPDGSVQNENLELYSQAIAHVANERGCWLVDLFHQLGPVTQSLGGTGPLTYNGIHLDRRGYWYAAQTMLSELGLSPQHVSISIDSQAGQVQATGTQVGNLLSQPEGVQFTARAERLVVPAPGDDTVNLGQLRIKNLESGSYALTIDGQPITVATADQWDAGVPLVTGPLAEQADELLTAIERKNTLYFHRWRPENETYLFLFRKHEQGNNAVEIPQFDPLVSDAEQSIERLRQSGTHTFEIIRHVTPTR